MKLLFFYLLIDCFSQVQPTQELDNEVKLVEGKQSKLKPLAEKQVLCPSMNQTCYETDGLK